MQCSYKAIDISCKGQVADTPLCSQWLGREQQYIYLLRNPSEIEGKTHTPCWKAFWEIVVEVK